MRIEFYVSSCNSGHLLDNWLNNPFIAGHNLTVTYDLNRDKGLPERYNEFLDMKEHSESWIVFSHDDVKITEDIAQKLEKLPHDKIYGACGVRKIDGKGTIVGEVGYVSDNRTLGKRMSGAYVEVAAFDPFLIMIPPDFPQFYFDENLKYHMHAEEMCIRLMKDHCIGSAVAQIECIHYSAGEKNKEYHEAVNYVKKKHGLEKFITTCDKSALDGEPEIGWKEI